MALTARFQWQNYDRTADLNARLQQLVQRGIYWGGELNPGAGLTVVIDPFIGVSYDGMTVADAVPTTLVVMAGTTNYVVARCKYNALGSPALPTLAWQVLSQAAYLADPEKDYLVVFGVVTLAGGAINVFNADIDRSLRDEITPVGRSWFRGVEAVSAALPVPPPIQNKTGDYYYVTADNTFYFWDGAAWTPMNTSGYNCETVVANQTLVENEAQRRINGSGVVSGPRAKASPIEYGAADLEINVIETPFILDTLDIDTFSAVVNGNFVTTKATRLLLPMAPPHPAGVDRYDLVFLEVWREALAVPETQTYARNPVGAAAYTLTQAETVVDTTYVSGTTAALGDNFDFNLVGISNHSGYAVKWRLSTVEDVPVNALYEPADNAIAALAHNIDGVHFTGSLINDPRIWRSLASATPLGGYSYALPLFVVRRTEPEHLGNITIFRLVSGISTRYIFPVYPAADVDKLAHDLVNTAVYNNPLPGVAGITAVTSDAPSGFITGMDYPVGPGTIDNSISYYPNNKSPKVRVRDFEDRPVFNGGNESIYIGTWPVGANSWERTLVYLKMSITLYANESAGTAYVSTKHRPLVPAALPAGVGSPNAQGWRRGYLTWEVMYQAFPNATYRDEDDAMTAAGWSRGDHSAGSTFTYVDGGIWSKHVDLDSDDRIHPYLTQWAIPICLVHRRNSQNWTLTNQNGTATRPDTRNDPAHIHADDMVDLRHQVDIDEGSLKAKLEADIDKLMKGQLRTRMADKWAGGGIGGEVAGSRILQIDEIAAIPSAGAFKLPAPDDMRTIWSDAKEFVPVCDSFVMNADYNPIAPNTLVSYDNTNGVHGILTLRSPPGAHLVRWLPSSFVACGDEALASSIYLQYDGPPLFSTRDYFERVTFPYPVAASGKVLVTTAGPPDYNVDTDMVNIAEIGWPKFISDPTPATPGHKEVDSYGRATAMTMDFTGIVALATHIASLSWWVHYPRSLTDAAYTDNYGLAEIPDEVHDVIKNPGGGHTHLGVGTLYTVVRKVVAGLTTMISAANVAAVCGHAGAVTLLGIAVENIRYSKLPAVALTRVVMDDAQQNITIIWGAPGITQTIDVIVFYQTASVTEWVEIGRGGKSVAGPFTWHQEDIDFGADPGTGHAFTLGTSWWKHAEVAGSWVEMPIVWRRNVPGADWDLIRLHAPAGALPVVPAAPLSAGYPYSNVVSLSDLRCATAYRYLKVVVPKTSILATGESLQIAYTYTPYQGLSSSGGAVVNPIPAATMTALKGMLHGTVIDNSDWYVTQSGACSKFGGVDSWTGWPVREPDPYLNFNNAAFSSYNLTHLVKSTYQGLQSTSGTKATDINAAAVLRLPFPESSTLTYNAYAPHEFDLDPGREGASCGWFSYALGYPNAFTTVHDALIGAYARTDQFVNGLTPLCLFGYQAQQEQSRVIMPCELYPSMNAVAANSATYPATGMIEYPWWQVAASKSLVLDGSMKQRRGDLLGLVAAKVQQYSVYEAAGGTSDDLSHSALAMSTALTPYGMGGHVPADTYFNSIIQNTWPEPLNTPGQQNAFFCYAPGTLHAYYQSLYLDIQPFLRLSIDTNVEANTRFLCGIYTVTEGNAVHFTSGKHTAHEETAGALVRKRTDLIKMPFASGSAVPAVVNISLAYPQYSDSVQGRTSLVDANIAYPTSWDAGTITSAEGLIRASEFFHTGYGRGVFLSDTGGHTRKNMPVLVPGSGTTLNEVFYVPDAVSTTTLPVATAAPPEQFPYAPSEIPFAPSHRKYLSADPGGPLAYSFFGAHINPASSAYQGRVVMQISGGPTCQVTTLALGPAQFTDELAAGGTALDAFWPSGRPVLRKR